MHHPRFGLLTYFHNRLNNGAPRSPRLIVNATRVSRAEYVRLSAGLGTPTEAQSSRNENTSNLARALTLVAKATADADDTHLLDEAVDLLRKILCQRSISEMTAEYVAVHVNLADAFHTLAERAAPAERLRYLECTLNTLTEALSVIVPPKYRAVVELHWAELT
jgi:hypothetical protein